MVGKLRSGSGVPGPGIVCLRCTGEQEDWKWFSCPKLLCLETKAEARSLAHWEGWSVIYMGAQGQALRGRGTVQGGLDAGLDSERPVSESPGPQRGVKMSRACVVSPGQVGSGGGGELCACLFWTPLVSTVSTRTVQNLPGQGGVN